ncbi:BTB/POZ domain-containing protein [Hibiscus syriacus]|uniref:BTB/POZ domain-containing protein n=1 Tax=Hibiscus syriacus TaxID=106335 RepID=A0A6A3BLG7_HIBSY|nr:BTB/POZ domain-containing protein [Hibiscus syriacus]
MESFQSWVSEHKLTAIGAVWASAIGASLAYNSGGRSSLKPSLRLILQGLNSGGAVWCSCVPLLK